MSDKKKKESAAAATDGKIPVALLKLVDRPVTNKQGAVVTEGTGEKAKPKMRAVKADEVFAWREYPDRVVIVTTDGRKFVGEK